MLRAVVAALFLAAPAAPRAQETERGDIHWAYSSYFGSGWYRIVGDREVFVVRMMPRWQWGEPSMDDESGRRVGVEFRLPVSVGVDHFELDDPLGIVDLDNLAFLSVTPGIEVEIPVNRVWTLRPFASLGYGRAADGSQSAWTYWGGIKSRLSFRAGRLDGALLNSAGFVGYTPGSGPSDSVWPLMSGLEFAYPVGRAAEEPDRQLLLHWHLAYTGFADQLEFSNTLTVDSSIRDQWEVGVALGRRNARIGFGFLEFERLGLGYRTSSDGELRGITFVFQSLFEL